MAFFLINFTLYNFPTQMTIKELKSDQFFLLAGPCVVESQEICEEVAEKLCEITSRLGIKYVFKASYRKANRSRPDSFTGIGNDSALKILAGVKKKFSVPILTDVHSTSEIPWAAEVADIVQIPAFLCRQTDLLVAAGESGKIVNIKKGQFLAPESMKYAVQKVTETGNEQILLTDRGTMFGYGDLIVDYRGIPEMKKLGYPVVLDITHSLQQPNQSEGIAGGKPEMIETIARAGIAVGVDGIFMETHPDPSKALSDGANMLALDKAEKLLQNLKEIRKTIIKMDNL